MKRIPLKSGFEYDALTRARHYLCYTTKSKTKSIAKRKYQKRFRQTVRTMLRRGEFD